MRKQILVSMILLALAGYARAEDPAIQNVSFYEKTDGSREIVVNYDAFDADGDLLTISIEASLSIYGPPLLAAMTVSGDVGHGIVPGMGKTAVWDLAADYPGIYFPSMVVRVVANDGHSLYVRILRGETDPYNPQDPQIYPYWERKYPNSSVVRQSFAEGDTVPHRARVVFKVIGWEGTANREVSRGRQTLEFQGRYDGTGLFNEFVPYAFASQSSELHSTPEWTTPQGSSDTLSFLAGPFDYTVTLRVTDGGIIEPTSSDSFSFHAGFTPIVQAIEPRTPSLPPNNYAGYATDPMIADVETLYCSQVPSPPPGHSSWIAIPQVQASQIWFRLETGQVWLERPPAPVGVDSVIAIHFEYALGLFGTDHPWEQFFPPVPPGNKLRSWSPLDRVFSWNYQITSERDPENHYHDGAGIDDLEAVTCADPSATPADPIYIDSNGVWTLRIRVGVPTLLLVGGPDAYLTYLATLFGSENVPAIFDLTTGQLGLTTGLFRARDVSPGYCRPEHCAHIVFRHARVPEIHGESCTEWYEDEFFSLPLDDFGIPSPPVSKNYVLKIVTNTGQIFP